MTFSSILNMEYNLCVKTDHCHDLWNSTNNSHCSQNIQSEFNDLMLLSSSKTKPIVMTQYTVCTGYNVLC